MPAPWTMVGAGSYVYPHLMVAEPVCVLMTSLSRNVTRFPSSERKSKGRDQIVTNTQELERRGTSYVWDIIELSMCQTETL